MIRLFSLLSLGFSSIFSLIMPISRVYIPPKPGGGGSTPSTNVTVSLSNFQMTPLSLVNTTSQGSYKFSSTSSVNVTVKIGIINDLYPEGIDFYTKTVKSTSGYNSFVYDNAYTRDKNEIRISYTYNGKTSGYTRTIGLINGGSLLIDEDNYVYTPNNNLLLYANSKFSSTAKVSYTFNNFSSVLIPNYYHELDISNLSISTDRINLETALFEGATLYISNRNGLFSDFDHDEDYAYIPLDLINNGNGNYSFIFKDIMYVEPKKLYMSKNPKPGYVETTHFYFPRNEMRYQGEYDFNISMQNFGMDKIVVNFPFKLNAFANTLGDCYNSEYCIKNKNAQVNDFGKILA